MVGQTCQGYFKDQIEVDIICLCLVLCLSTEYHKTEWLDEFYLLHKETLIKEECDSKEIYTQTCTKGFRFAIIEV